MARFAHVWLIGAGIKGYTATQSAGSSSRAALSRANAGSPVSGGTARAP
eukprot:CAMPEP_0119093378 /NCGR_PEP_ID=MMETSP1178-20130426/162923_1 /TAXON_ID=33656 /ORGANISM="unid sp, Strain CCMP2000" /LENGTH=48 /DNA_ID= /DNA_START= /DNA_END= /DNA_ORIENTATION=